MLLGQHATSMGGNDAVQSDNAAPATPFQGSAEYGRISRLGHYDLLDRCRASSDASPDLNRLYRTLEYGKHLVNVASLDKLTRPRGNYVPTVPGLMTGKFGNDEKRPFIAATENRERRHIGTMIDRIVAPFATRDPIGIHRQNFAQFGSIENDALGGTPVL